MDQRRSGSFAFDLEPDEDDEVFEEPPAEPTRLHRAASALGARVRSWPRRRVVAAATVVAVLAAGGAGTGLLVSQAHQRAWAKVAATTPGAVVDLGRAPVEVAKVKLRGPTPLALVDGTLVVQEAVRGNDDPPSLAGIDLDTGKLAWTSHLPAGTHVCTAGPPDQWTMSQVTTRVISAALIVCTSDDQRSVTVVDGDGTVLATRELADPLADATLPDLSYLGTIGSSAHHLIVTPDGGLIRIDRVGEQATPPPNTPLAIPDAATGNVGFRTTTLLGPLVTRDVRVRLEDAATGEVRWETVVAAAGLPAGAVLQEAGPCLSYANSSDDVAVDPDASAREALGPQRLETAGCGLDAVLDLRTGKIVEQHDVFAPDYGQVWAPPLPLPGGGWGELVGPTSDGDSQDITTRINAPDGTVVGEIPGVVLPALASDGTASPLLLTSDGSQVPGQAPGVTAYDTRGSVRWSAPTVKGARVLARTADAVVVTDGRTVKGLDPATGALRWTHRAPTQAGMDAMSLLYGTLDALTDGHRVAVVSLADPSSGSDPQSAEKSTTALDLRTGGVVWKATSSEPVPYVVAGHLVRFDADAVVLLR